MNIRCTRHTYSSIGKAIAGLPLRQRSLIVKNLTLLLTEGLGSRLDRKFAASEGWEDLANYLVGQLSLKLPEDTTIALEWKGKKAWIACYEEAGSIDKQFKICVSQVAYLSRKDKNIANLLLAMCSQLVRVNGISTWDTGELWNTGAAIDSLKEREGYGEFPKEAIREIRKILARYGRNGIASRYSRILTTKKPMGHAHKIAKSMMITNCPPDIKKLCEIFLRLSSITESLDSYRSDSLRNEVEDINGIQPVPISHAFILYWRDDELQAEIDDTVNMHFQEAGLETIFLKSILVDSNGYSKKMKNKPELPRLLEKFFNAFNKVVDNRTVKRRGRRINQKVATHPDIIEV